jgi:hypothetical protein
MRQALSLAAIAILLVWWAPAGAATVTYAIVIGNNDPPTEGAAEQLRPLRYADDDAVRYHQLFSAIGKARLLAVLDRETQRRYPGLAATAEPATLENLRRIVRSYGADMAADRRRGDQPVFYFVFSGHGARDRSGAAFLALVDGALTQDVLYDEVIARLPSVYSHLLIDACHAGGVVGVRGDLFAREVEGHTTSVGPDDLLPLLETRRLARFPHVGVILATTLGQEAHEWSEIESGIFTHELISGLLGPADVNQDGVIEYTEVQAYIAAANRGIKDPRAIPQVIAIPPRANQNVALLNLSAFASARVLEGELGRLGHFHVELENGQRYLDAHLARGAPATVILPGDGAAFLRTRTHEARIPPRKLVALGDLQLAARSTRSRGALDRTYRSALFSSEYGRSYYQGYVDSIGAVGVRFPADAVELGGEGPGPPRGNRPLAVGALSLAGGAAVVSGTTAVLAVRAKQDFDATNLQRPAHEAKERYERHRLISIATGVTALAAGAASWWLWPRARAAVIPAASGRGDYALTLEVPW